MIKFILHGGETKIENEHNKNFYKEWVKSFDETIIPTILLVYFATQNDRWKEKEKLDTERFAKYTNNRKVNFTIASEDMDEFKKQIKLADVVYFRGGDTYKLANTMKDIKDSLLELMDGKVCAGSSAGVMFLSKYSRSRTRDWNTWLGLIPINSIVHYSDEKHKESLEKFKKENPDNTNEYIILPETEFVVRYF